MESISAPTTEGGPASPGVAVGVLTEGQRRALDELGYLILPDVVDAGILDRLRSAFDRVCDAEGIPTSGTRHPRGLIDAEPAFAGFLTHPPLLAAVRHILNETFRLGAVAGRDPLPGFGQQGLHMDCVDPGPSAPYSVVTALGLIDDFHEDNGATRVVPGSHRARRPPPKGFADPASRHPDQVVVTAPAGSVLVFNGHLWHSGTRNRSGGHRRAVQCSFGAEGMRGPSPSGH